MEIAKNGFSGVQDFSGDPRPPLETYLRTRSFIILQIVKTFIWTILSESQDFEATYSQQFPSLETVNPSWRRLSSRNASIHLITHSYPYTQTSYSHTHIATPSISLFTFTLTHGSCPQIYSRPVYVLFYPFMLNILFANPISLKTNVGPTPYYTKYEHVSFFPVVL